MHLKHTCPNTNTSLAQAHLGWSSKLEDGEKDGEVVPEQNLWLRYDVFLLLQKFKGTKGQTRNNDCKSFSSNRTKILTKQAPEDVASDADGVEALPRPSASSSISSLLPQVLNTWCKSPASPPRETWTQCQVLRCPGNIEWGNLWTFGSTQITVSFSPRQPATSKLP